MADEKVPFHNPFAQLRPAGAAPAAPSAPATPSPSSARPPIPRAVVRIERSGRGGKEVTVVEHMALAPAARERMLKTLKSTLGCGGVVEGDALVLQGDHRSRLPAILSDLGVRKVTVG